MVTIVVIAALVACLVGALYVAKGIRLTEYTSHRNRGSFSHIVFTLLGTLVGGWMFFGLSAIGYEAGIVGYFIGLGYAIGLVILALCSKRIKGAADKHRCDTIDDLIGARYGKTAQTITTLINMVVFLAILAAQFVAMSGFLLVFTDIQSQLAFYVAAVVVIVYTAASGFKGVLFTDFWQFVILSISAICIFCLLTVKRDPAEISALDPTYFKGTGYGVGFLVGVVVLFPLSLLCRSDMWQRISCAKDHRVARNAFLVTAPLILIFYVLLTTIGIYARAALGPEQRGDIAGFIHFLNVVRSSAFPAWATQVFLSTMALGVFAALLSTADSYINIVAISVSKLFIRTQWKDFEQEASADQPSSNERSILRSTRVLAVIFGILAVVLAKTIPDIVDLIVGGISVLFVLLPAVLVGLFAKKERHRSVPTIASLLTGLASFIYFFCTLANPKIAFIPATLVALIVYIAVASFSKAHSA